MLVIDAREVPRGPGLTRRLLPIVGLAIVSGAGASAQVRSSQAGKRAAPATHRIVLHVGTNDPATMAHAIGNADNAMRTYRTLGQDVQIEIVANGAGAHMFRRDTSPVRAGLDHLRAVYPEIVLSICGITGSIWEKNEGKAIALLDGVRVVPAGIVRIAELQEAGWSYVRP
jgi:hypothetical protein